MFKMQSFSKKTQKIIYTHGILKCYIFIKIILERLDWRSGPHGTFGYSRTPRCTKTLQTTITYGRRRYFNSCLKADISQLNLPHGTKK